MYQVVDADMSLHMFILQWAAACEMGTATFTPSVAIVGEVWFVALGDMSVN